MSEQFLREGYFMKDVMQKINKPNILFLLGILILTWLSLIFIISTILFLFGQTLSIISIISSSICTIFVWVYLVRKYVPLSVLEAIIGILLFIVSVFGSIGISGIVFDNSWDGQDYHQRAISRIANGFNPIYDFAQPDEYYNRALNFYPKAPWIISACLYQATQNIESGKAINILLLLAGFNILCAILLDMRKINTWLSTISAALIICNPVAIAQVFSFYIDGLVGTLLTIFILAIYIYLNKNKKIGFYLIVLTLILGLNIKFTGTAYFIVFALVSILFQWIIENNKIKIPSISWAILVGLLLGMLVFGVSPYMTNILKYQNPFYPIYGGTNNVNKNFIMGGQSPSDFTHMGVVESLARSIFSKSSNAYGDTSSELKIPFSVTLPELKAFRSPDVRVGGFGPFFGGILLITVIIIFRRCQTKKEYPRWMILLALGGILISIIINEENWWARYVPQLWLLPCLGILIAINNHGKVMTFARVLLCFFMAANLLAVAVPNFYFNLKMTQSIDTVLTKLSKSKDSYLVYLGSFQPWTLKLDHYGVHYTLVSSYEELPCPKIVQYIYYSKVDCH